MIHFSIIIPTKDRALLLEKALSSIVSQHFSPNDFEVIVVDNGSTDQTKEISQSFQGKIKNFSLHYQESPGLHVGRNFGAQTAKGEILIFIDDDIRANPHWLEGIQESFHQPEIVLTGGNNSPEYESPPPDWLHLLWQKTPYGKVLGYLSLLDFGDQIKTIDPLYVGGLNFSIKKSTLFEMGGFHPDAMPDSLTRFRGDGETAVSVEIKKKNYKALFNPKASVRHWVPNERMTFPYFYKRAYLQGISNSYSLIREKKGIPRHYPLQKKWHYYKLVLKKIIKNVPEPRLSISLGEIKGHLFLINEIQKDPGLLNWILKPNYY